MAAALHTFHLDTMLRAEEDRPTAAADPLANSPHTRDYIAKTVLGPLPEDVQDFIRQAQDPRWDSRYRGLGVVIQHGCVHSFGGWSEGAPPTTQGAPVPR